MRRRHRSYKWSHPGDNGFCAGRCCLFRKLDLIVQEIGAPPRTRVSLANTSTCDLSKSRILSPCLCTQLPNHECSRSTMRELYSTRFPVYYPFRFELDPLVSESVTSQHLSAASNFAPTKSHRCMIENISARQTDRR